jgi:acarbose 7IV-phosphotransferase
MTSTVTFVRVLVVGAASWDTIVHVHRFPEPRAQTMFADRSYETVGATGAGKAMNLARLGHEVHLHTLLGDDEPGEKVARALRDSGIQLHVDRCDGPTEQHVNLMNRDGERLSIYRNVCRPRPGLDISPIADLALTCDAVVLNITDYVRRLVPILEHAGKPFWTDLHDWDGSNPYHLDFTAASWIVLSGEALSDATSTCRRLADQSELVVCTHGRRGAVAYVGDHTIDVAAVDGAAVDVVAVGANQVVDTNGAGDAFTAGLMHGVNEGWSLERSLRAAAIAGAMAVSSTELAAPDLTADMLEQGTR